jgi:hypothetical protein
MPYAQNEEGQIKAKVLARCQPCVLSFVKINLDSFFRPDFTALSHRSIKSQLRKEDNLNFKVDLRTADNPIRVVIKKRLNYLLVTLSNMYTFSCDLNRSTIAFHGESEPIMSFYKIGS